MGEKKIYKHFGVICPKCFNISYVKVALEPEKCENSCEDWINFGKRISLESSFVYTCSSCRKNVLGITVDSNIAEAIALLNKKGYKTEHCCGGDNTFPYIAFDRKMEESKRTHLRSALEGSDVVFEEETKESYNRIVIYSEKDTKTNGQYTAEEARNIMKNASERFLHFAESLPSFKSAVYPEKRSCLSIISVDILKER